MSPVEVTSDRVPSWPGQGPAGRVVAAFLARVRVGCDAEAAEELMALEVTAHQLVAADPHTVVRTPAQYAQHARDLRRRHGPATFEITAALEQGDLVHVRFRERGRGLELGSVDYRVTDGRVAEYWIQPDHHPQPEGEER